MPPSVPAVLPRIILLLAANTAIAAFLSAISFGMGFGINLITSQCVGLAIYAAVRPAHAWLESQPAWLKIAGITVAIAIGATSGLAVSTVFTGVDLAGLIASDPAFIVRTLLFCLLFGATVSYIFISQYQLIRIGNEAREERLRRLLLEKETAEMELKMLQAQIEPHFLFNTLSTIESLLGHQPETARAMLLDLTRYLRTTLARTRRTISTLRQEMEVVGAYLSICKIRMGDRLAFDIRLPPEMAELACPPLLIQPLVENSVRHGLEPAVGGGKIKISCETDGNTVTVSVSDNGVGISGTAAPGDGTASIASRLAALYGDRASLMLGETKPGGVTAVVRYPHVQC